VKRGLVRLDPLSEEQLRQRLAFAQEVGLSPAELPPLVERWAARFAEDFEMRGDVSFGPAVLLQSRPDLATLPIRYGRASRLGGSASLELQRLSRRLHALLDLAAPADGQGQRRDLALLRQLLRGERLGRKPLWLRAEAVPTLVQVLMHEDEPVRALLIDLLADIDGKPATVALAQRAVFDLSAEVRHQAIEALRSRPREEGRLVFVDALRYPWAPPAEHAAEALVALDDYGSVPYLVSLLKEPTPLAPFPVGKERWAMREVVALRHVNNCLACHPPASSGDEPVPGTVPNVNITHVSRRLVRGGSAAAAPGTGGSGGGGGGGGGYGGGGGGSASGTTSTVPGGPSIQTRVDTAPVLIRADITYLRQDFSVRLPVLEPGALQLVPLRFDYLVRTRLLTARQARELHKQTDDLATYPQREAVLSALRELTGRDAGPTTAAWEGLYPAAEQEARGGRLTLALLAAAADRNDALIARYRDAKGVIYTDALAGAIPRLPAGAQNKARMALVERLGRMTPATLRRKLADDDTEVRRAAVHACLSRESREFVPDLIALLDDSEPAVALPAREGLRKLTGDDGK